jgi:hypothetical protein
MPKAIRYLVSFMMVFIGSVFFYSSAYASVHSLVRPDGHAPIGVMRDHVHKKGEFMASYRVSYMKMKGLRNGDDKVTVGEALNSYMSSPVEMSMRMHMVGLMYGVTNKVTFVGMGGLLQKDMDGKHKMTGDFNRKANGIGDSRISVLYEFFNDGANRAQFNIGVSLPTGSIEERYGDATVRLPYSMQLGSGSYELLPGIGYSGRKEKYFYGGQVNGVFRLDGNDNGYKFGDGYNFTAWVSRKVNNSFSVSSRFDYNKSEAIEGIDGNMMGLAMISTVDTSLYGQERLDLLFGINYLISSQGYLDGNRLAFEVGAPVYRRIDGPMLEVDYKFIIGWQKAF